MKRKATMATFERLREIREVDLGWDVTDLLAKVGGRPSVAGIYRLEQGRAIRVTSARRVFDAVNQALGNKLDPKKELKIE
jgi:hypothetical protein